MLHFHCACGTEIAAPEEYEGRAVTCPNCALAVVARREGAPVGPPAAPAYVPVPPPVPASPLGYATVVGEAQYGAGQGRRANGLGIAALVLGLVAMLFTWIPFCGLVPTLIFAVIGGILGVVGLIAALSDRRTGIAFPVAGLAVCAAAPLVSLACIGLYTSAMNRAAAAKQAQVAAANAAATLSAQTNVTTPAPPSPMAPIDASAVAQAERVQLIRKLQQERVLTKVEPPKDGVVRMYVGPAFAAADLDRKQSIASAVYAWAWTQDPSVTAVVIHDGRDEKKLGSFDPESGLELQ